MVHFKAALCSTLLASAGLAAAYPAASPHVQSVSLEKREAIIARGVDPARIDAIRNRVNRPKEASEPELEPKLPGDKKAALAPKEKVPAHAAESTSPPPPRGPNQNSNGPQKPGSGSTQPTDKSAPKPPPKALLPGAKKLSLPAAQGDQSQQSPIIKGNRPSYNAKKGGVGKTPADTEGSLDVVPQPSKQSGGTTSQPNPSTSVSRGGNAPRPDTKDSKKGKAERKGKPKVQSGSDDLEGSERVARDAVEGAGTPKDRAQPSKDLKASKKPNTKNKQGSVGKGGLQTKPPQSQPQESAGTSTSDILPAPQESAKEDNHGDFGVDGANDDDDDYFEWFRTNEKTPTRYVVKAKDGYKSQYRLDQGEDGLAKLPINQRREQKQQEAKANEAGGEQ